MHFSANLGVLAVILGRVFPRHCWRSTLWVHCMLHGLKRENYGHMTPCEHNLGRTR